MLKDPAISDKLAKDGYVVIDAGLMDEIRQIQAYIDQRFTIAGDDFYYSLLSNTYDENKILRDFIRDVLRRFYEEYFEGYRTITESFLAKPAHTSGELLLHQDWCYTDESKYAAYNIWIPLCDVTRENGAMVFLPGSHMWYDHLRSSTLPTARISSRSFIDQGAEIVEVKKGQALVFHPAVFHGSGPNLSAQHRIVATSTILDRDAPFLYFQKKGDKEVSVLHPDDEAFLRDLHSLATGGDGGLHAERQIAYEYHLITEAELLADCRLQNEVKFR